MDTSKLTDHDIEVLISMFTIHVHAAETAILSAKDALVQRFKQTREYAKSCKKEGEDLSNKKLERYVEDNLYYKQGTRIGQVLKEMERMENVLSKLTIDMSSERNNEFQVAFYDDLHNDANLMCRCLCYATNCKSMADWLKVESTMKLYAKGNLVSDEVIKLFNPQN